MIAACNCNGDLARLMLSLLFSLPPEISATEYHRLETQLIAAEDVFLETIVFRAKAIEIRTELRRLLAKVTAERIRAEERERETTKS